MSNEKLSKEALNPPLRKGIVMCRFFIPKTIKCILLWLTTSIIGAFLIKILNQIL
jgi:hypothetical protein